VGHRHAFLVSRVVTHEGLKGETDETAHHRGRKCRNSRRQQRVRPKFSIAGQRTRGPDSGPTDGWPPANYRSSNHNWTGPGQGSWFSGDVTIWRQGRCNRCAESRSCAAQHSRWTKRAPRLTDRGADFWRRMDRLQGPTPEKEYFVTVAVAEHDGGFGGFHGRISPGMGPIGVRLRLRPGVVLFPSVPLRAFPLTSDPGRSE
jgi:hypothetical protein